MITKGSHTSSGTRLLHNGASIGTVLKKLKGYTFMPSVIGEALGFKEKVFQTFVICADELAQALNTKAYVSRETVTSTGIHNDIEYLNVREGLGCTEHLQQGQQAYYLRGESEDLACNKIKIPRLKLQLGVAPHAERDKHRAFITLFGRTVPLCSAATESELDERVVWDLLYSNFAHSTAYRAFRTLYGFEYASKNYQTPDQVKDVQRRTLKAMSAAVGAPAEAMQTALGV